MSRGRDRMYRKLGELELLVEGNTRVVEQIMGHGKLKVRCADGKTRLGRIPGKMKKDIWIRKAWF